MFKNNRSAKRLSLSGKNRSTKSSMPDSKKKYRLYFAIVLLLAAIGVGWFVGKNRTDKINNKNDQVFAAQSVERYEDCIKTSGSVLSKTFPKQCTVGGKTLTETIDKSKDQFADLNPAVKLLDPQKACKQKQDVPVGVLSSDPAVTVYGDFNGDKVLDVVIGLVKVGDDKIGVVCAYTASVDGKELRQMYIMPGSDNFVFGRPEAFESNAFKYKGAKSYLGGTTTVDASATYRWSGSTFIKE